MSQHENIFMQWWNRLASHNGKLKFRTQREAADFIRRVHNENQGPNQKLLEMRQKYNQVKRAQSGQQNFGSRKGEC